MVLMARTQTLVQLSDDLLALLDARAAASGRSRSALIREAIEHFLAEDAGARIDAAIAAGYAEAPAPPPDALTEAIATSVIEAEPW